MTRYQYARRSARRNQAASEGRRKRRATSFHPPSPATPQTQHPAAGTARPFPPAPTPLLSCTPSCCTDRARPARPQRRSTRPGRPVPGRPALAAARRSRAGPCGSRRSRPPPGRRARSTRRRRRRRGGPVYRVSDDGWEGEGERRHTAMLSRTDTTPLLHLSLLVAGENVTLHAHFSSALRFRKPPQRRTHQ